MISKFRNALFCTCIALVALSGSANAGAKEGNSGRNTISGSASWYGGQFHGRKTANGERYDMNGLTAAHRSLPFGTKVRVTNKKTGKSVVVRINDRGPFVGKRVIDLSRGAAKSINMLGTGVASVNLQVLK
jgi:rare lipoprotein A